MKLILDASRCEGYGVCVDIAPAVFELGDDDEHVTLLEEEIDASREDQVKEAVAECPMAALRLEN